MTNKEKLSAFLVEAVISNDIALLSDLLNQGADPNTATDKDHITLLHHAAQNNSLETIPLLVEAGARLEAKTRPDGYTATEIAFINGNNRIVQLLVAYISGWDIIEH